VRYLVDSNVLSEVMRPAPNPRVVQWLDVHDAELAVSPLVLAEIETGILRHEPGRRRRALEQWFATAVRRIRVLDLDASVAERWARVQLRLFRAGTRVPFVDGYLAATALTHGIAVATRNEHDFTPTGVRVVNPFSGVPGK
jgi:predicted nucleic acid-binding protein